MNRGEFTRAIYERIGAPINGARLAFGIAWAAFENTDAQNNPWATTEPWLDAIEYNRAGVKNYRTIEDGIDATVATLLNGDYNYLLRILRDTRSTIRQCLNALDASPWGSHPNTMLWEEVVDEYYVYNKEIPGSGTVTVVPDVVPTVTPVEQPRYTPVTTYQSAPIITVSTNPGSEPIYINAEPTYKPVTPEESETKVDNETPVEDTLESRLAKLPKPLSIQEQLDLENKETTTTSESTEDFLGN